MAFGLNIKTELLPPKPLKKFENTRKEILEKSIEEVISHFENPDLIDYEINLYVVPYVVYKDIPYQKDAKIRKVHFAFSFLDFNDLDKRAIYISYYFVLKLPEYASASLAHELGHLIYETKISDILRYIPKKGESAIEIEQKKEYDVAKEYENFKEPLKTRIHEWDKIGQTEEIRSTMKENVQSIEMDNFISKYFDEKKLDKKLVEKMLDIS